MTELSREVLQNWEVRKSKQQKEDFRGWLCRQLEAAGYAPQVEKHKTLWASHNVVAGDPDKAKVLLTAHYDTCAVLPFPNFITPRSLFWYLAYQLVLCVVIFLAAALMMAALEVLAFCVGVVLVLAERIDSRTVGEMMVYAAPLLYYLALLVCFWWMLDGKANRHTANDNTSGVVTLLELALALPEELRQEVCFVWFDNEERGLLGSGAFAAKHKQTAKTALVINFDCVGDGDSLQFFPAKRLKKTELPQLLEESYLAAGEKTVEVVRGFGFYPSDQAKFHRGVGVCALKKSPVCGYYMDKIHTRRDTVLDEENVALLCSGTVRLLRAQKEKEETYAK